MLNWQEVVKQLKDFYRYVYHSLIILIIPILLVIPKIALMT